MFFSDIEQFSTFSERLEPAALTALLNDVLGDMTDIILDEGGTLDKYVGDAIVAFWNAPLAQSDHALRAARAALRCQLRLVERRIELEQRTGVKLRMRIGLNTGEVLVGNLGSSRRFSYTVLGDAANLASRLEGSNKAFGTYLMASESLWNSLGGQMAGRELARLRVVGRAAPVRVYELTSLNPGDRPGFFDDFERAVKDVQAGRLEEALRQFEQWPLDPPSVAYAAQCRAWMSTPPEDGFDVWTLTEK